MGHVSCPERTCPHGGCPICNTVCNEPTCTLQCPSKQNCHNVCEVPKCRWNCTAPEVCPAPTCHMVCEQPPDCMATLHQALPPLSGNEVAVRAFIAPGGKAEAGSAPPIAVTTSTMQQESMKQETIKLPVKPAP